MNLREAAQQALDALELGCTDHDGNPVDLVGPAITALRSALAEDAMQRLTDVQQEMEAIINEMETVEPVAWMRVDRGHVDFHRHPDYLPLYTAPPTREPLTDCGEAGHDEGRCGNASCITRPQRKPLTMPQIHELDWPNYVAFEDILKFTRAKLQKNLPSSSEKWKKMKYIEIANELDKFVKWPDGNDRSIIGTHTAISFAEHIAGKVAQNWMEKWDWYMNNIRRTEREACAKVCEQATRDGAPTAYELAAAIRARGK